MWTRKYYFVFLSRDMIAKFVRQIFSKMKFNHKTYKVLIFKIRKLYKNWKNIIRIVVANFVERWIITILDNKTQYLKNFIIYRELKREFMENFQFVWFEFIFKFNLFIINVKKLSKETLKFLKCTFLLMLWKFITSWLFYLNVFIQTIINEKSRIFHNVNIFEIINS